MQYRTVLPILYQNHNSLPIHTKTMILTQLCHSKNRYLHLYIKSGKQVD